MSARLLLGCGIAFWLGVSPAFAQVFRIVETPRRGSVEIGGGLLWSAGFDVDSLPADLTANAGNQAPPVTWFNTETRVNGVGGVQARAGVFVTPSVAVEARVTYSRPVVSVRIFDDFEGAADLTVEQTMSRYAFDGSLVVYPRRSGARRGVPFFMVGAGYLRELHEGNELVETGTSYHAGGGVRYWLTRGRRGRLAFRAEALLTIRDGGYGGDEKRRAHPSVGASLGYVF
jgi:hypothetical protein